MKTFQFMAIYMILQAIYLNMAGREWLGTVSFIIAVTSYIIGLWQKDK
jgi:hypothetical protein